METVTPSDIIHGIYLVENDVSMLVFSKQPISLLINAGFLGWFPLLTEL